MNGAYSFLTSTLLLRINLPDGMSCHSIEIDNKNILRTVKAHCTMCPDFCLSDEVHAVWRQLKSALYLLFFLPRRPEKCKQMGYSENEDEYVDNNR